MCFELRQRSVPPSPVLSGSRLTSDGSGRGTRLVSSSSAVLVSPLAWRSTVRTGPTPRTQYVVRVNVPNGSPIAPACVTSESIRAASTPAGNAGTLTLACPM